MKPILTLPTLIALPVILADWLAKALILADISLSKP
jgi:hypothetical protein